MPPARTDELSKTRTRKMRSMSYLSALVGMGCVESTVAVAAVADAPERGIGRGLEQHGQRGLAKRAAQRSVADGP